MLTAYHRLSDRLLRTLSAAALTAAVIGFGMTLPGDPASHVLLAVAAVAALTVALAANGQVAWTIVPVRARVAGACGHVEAPTAYWCAVQPPSRPQRARAPGRH